MFIYYLHNNIFPEIKTYFSSTKLSKSLFLNQQRERIISLIDILKQIIQSTLYCCCYGRNSLRKKGRQCYWYRGALALSVILGRNPETIRFSVLDYEVALLTLNFSLSVEKVVFKYFLPYYIHLSYKNICCILSTKYLWVVACLIYWSVVCPIK
jgi:hypothetical protein